MQATTTTSVIITRAEEPEFSNYNITYVDGRVKITPKTVYVKSKDGLSKEYGDPDPDFNNTELIAEYIRGVVDDDELGLTFYRDASEAVGTYEIKAKITNTNYTLDFTRSQFIINKRLAIIVVNDSSKIYGEEDEQFDFVRTSMVLPEDVELVLNSIKRDVGEDAGEYKLYLDTSASLPWTQSLRFIRGKSRLLQMV